jgi:hypothetical protein
MDQSGATPHYRPLAPPTGDSAGGIAQAIAPGPTPTRVLPLTPVGRKPWPPLSPPCRLERAVAPRVLALLPPLMEPALNNPNLQQSPTYADFLPFSPVTRKDQWPFPHCFLQPVARISGLSPPFSPAIDRNQCPSPLPTTGSNQRMK